MVETVIVMFFLYLFYLVLDLITSGQAFFTICCFFGLLIIAGLLDCINNSNHYSDPALETKHKRTEKIVKTEKRHRQLNYDIVGYLEIRSILGERFFKALSSVIIESEATLEIQKDIIRLKQDAERKTKVATEAKEFLRGPELLSIQGQQEISYEKLNNRIMFLESNRRNIEKMLIECSEIKALIIDLNKKYNVKNDHLTKKNYEKMTDQLKASTIEYADFTPIKLFS